MSANNVDHADNPFRLNSSQAKSRTKPIYNQQNGKIIADFSSLLLNVGICIGGESCTKNCA